MKVGKRVRFGAELDIGSSGCFFRAFVGERLTLFFQT